MLTCAVKKVKNTTILEELDIFMLKKWQQKIFEN